MQTIYSSNVVDRLSFALLCLSACHLGPDYRLIWGVCFFFMKFVRIQYKGRDRWYRFVRSLAILPFVTLFHSLSICLFVCMFSLIASLRMRIDLYLYFNEIHQNSTKTSKQNREFWGVEHFAGYFMFCDFFLLLCILAYV